MKVYLLSLHITNTIQLQASFIKKTTTFNRLTKIINNKEHEDQNNK